VEAYIKSAKRSLDRVLEKYTRTGVPLGYVPKIAYFDEVYFESPRFIAIILPELTGIPKRSSQFLSELISAIEFREGYGLTVSDEAIQEYSHTLRGKKDNINGAGRVSQKYKDSEAEILLFRPFASLYQNQELTDEIMAHEVWHLVELNRDIFKIAPLIVEATATYAGRLSVGKDCPVPPEEYPTLDTMLYHGGGYVIQRMIQGSSNPYVRMLDKTIREDAQRQLMWRVRKKLVDLVHERVGNPTYQKSVKDQLMCIEEFRQLDGNVDDKTLLKVYSDLGAFKLVRELERQDLNKALEWFRSVGF